MFLCLLWRECYEENYLSFTCLNNFANDSKNKNRNLQGSFLAVYLSTHFVSFFRLILIPGPKTSLSHAKCDWFSHFVNIVTITEVILLAQ